MKKFTEQKLPTQLADSLAAGNFLSTLNGMIHFVRKGGKKKASARFNLILQTLKQDDALAHAFSQAFYTWVNKIYVYPALVKLGIFSRRGFTRELINRIYERFSPSYKDLNNLHDIFLYLFHSSDDEQWLNTISIRQWLDFYALLQRSADKNTMQAVARKLTDARLRAVEMLSVWIAAEALEPEFIRLNAKLLEADSAFVALQRETAKLVEHYRNTTDTYDTAHLEVMFDQCRKLVDHLRRRGTGAGSGSSVKVAHLLERLQQTLCRLKLLIDLQTQPENHSRLTISLMTSLIFAAVEQYSTRHLRRSSIHMLAKSITENKSHHGEHYITRNRKEYMAMFYSAAGGGVLIALMALHKIHIASLGFGDFMTAFLAGLNYGLGFMLIHILHFTVATKQPAMTAASFAEQVERNEGGRAVDMKLAKLLVDVCRSQSVAVFGNVSIAILIAGIVSFMFQWNTHMPILNEHNVDYQLKSLEIFTQPTLWYAAIAGVWLFCSGIIAGFFDNRADYLNIRNRLAIHPFLRNTLPAVFRQKLANYIHKHYGSLIGNFIFGMLLGMTGYFGHLLGLPLDIRHVAFSSANLGYATISGSLPPYEFIFYLFSVLAIGLVNLLVSFSLALLVALRSRDARICSVSRLAQAFWKQIKDKPLALIYPVQTDTPAENKKSDT